VEGTVEEGIQTNIGFSERNITTIEKLPQKSRGFRKAPMIAKKNRHLSGSFFSPPGPVLPFGFFGDTTQKWRQQALTQEFVPKAELGQSVPRPRSYKRVSS